MTYTEETGAHVTPERIRRGAEEMEARGFWLVYECPMSVSDEERRIYREYWKASAEFYQDLLQDPEVKEIEDRALVESGLLRRLVAQIGDDQEPTENWREVLRAL